MIQPLFMADFASGMTGVWAFVRLSDSGWPQGGCNGRDQPGAAVLVLGDQLVGLPVPLPGYLLRLLHDRHSRGRGFLWIWTVEVLVLSIAIGTVSYYVIELPSRRVGRQLARREAREGRETRRARRPHLGLLGSGYVA